MLANCASIALESEQIKPSRSSPRLANRCASHKIGQPLAPLLPTSCAPEPLAPDLSSTSAHQPLAPHSSAFSAPQPLAPHSSNRQLGFQPYPNCDEVLTKLQKIAVSKNLDENFLKQAKDILAPFKQTVYQFSQTNSQLLLNLREDNQARKVLIMCEKSFRKFRPLYTEPDGNCVYNTIILYLRASNSVELVKQLRIAVVCELLFYSRCYYSVLQKYCRTMNVEFIEQEIRSEMRAACKDRGWCGFVSFAALATIISHPIRLIHPIFSVATESQVSYNSQAMNQILYPVRGTTQFDVVHVLCCGNETELFENPTKWRMNHFVLLVDPSISPTSTPTTQQGCRRDSEFEEEAANSPRMQNFKNSLLADGCTYEVSSYHFTHLKNIVLMLINY